MPSSAANAAADCPSCGLPGSACQLPLPGGGSLAAALCYRCHGVWFDAVAGVEPDRDGVIELLRLMREHSGDPRRPLAAELHCPRCAERLLHAVERTARGSFNYYRCLQNHGRFTSFAQFMIERGFVRHLDGAEIAAISTRLRALRCAGCGASIELGQATACGHCGAPIATLDTGAVDRELARHERSQPQPQPQPRDALAMAEVLISLERQKNELQRVQREALRSDFGQVVGASAALLWRLLRR